MNTQVQLPASRHIISLASSAFLALIETHIYTGTSQNKEASAELTANKKADPNAAKVQQYLFAGCKEFKAIVDYRQRIYNWSKKIGFDWAGNIRCIPQTEKQKLLTEYATHELTFYALVDSFGLVYSDTVLRAAATQGELFNKALYPKWEVLKNKYSCNLLPMDIPAGDFREALFQECAEDMKAHYERQASKMMDRMMEEISERLISIAGRVSHACTDVSGEVDANGKPRRAKKIYDGTVQEAKAIVATIRCLNVTDNERLTEAANRMEAALTDVTTDGLKDSAYLRSQVKEQVDGMLREFVPDEQPEFADTVAPEEAGIEAADEEEDESEILSKFAPLKALR